MGYVGGSGGCQQHCQRSYALLRSYHLIILSNEICGSQGKWSNWCKYPGNWWPRTVSGLYLSQFLWKTAQIPLDATPALIPFQTNSQWYWFTIDPPLLMSNVSLQKKAVARILERFPGVAKPMLFVSNLWWHFSKGIINYCQLENVTQILLVWGANLVEMTKRDNNFHFDEWERKLGVLKWAISCVCSTPESSAPSQISATEKQRVTVSLEVTEKGDAWVNPSETVARIG